MANIGPGVYSVEYSKNALKTLMRIPRTTRELIQAKVDAFAKAPAQAANVKSLVGRPGFRLRVGDWRVIFDIDEGRLVVLVLQIGSRGGIYR
jgi:mRNA interferase RelE/StbE